MPGRIMIVDDEPALLTMLRYNLERHDFEVTEATTGEQALELAIRSPPDAILLDWMLPRMSGLDVCRELRRLPNTSHTPVIMLTARVAEADRVQGLSVGADDFVAKPFSIAELIARLRALLRRSARQ
ncbi:MAG: response regulator, partial [Alphaproteobacteria bacterium]|nr:response regulator [Alphaproteobacteria bacterium]